MIKKWKKAATLVVMTTTLFAGTLNVSAEGVKDVFDAKYYADTNADLKAIYGYDEKALYNHYITYGIKEGRCGSQTFNVAAYRMAYPDLQAAFGDNWDAYVNHYFTVGKAEGRMAGTLGTAVNAGAVGGTGAVGTVGNQQTASMQVIGSSVQHGSKFYSKNWSPLETYTMDYINGNESYISTYGRQITVTDLDYWHTGLGNAPEGYEIKTIKLSIRNRTGSIPGAIAVYETMEFDYYNWAVGFESPSALQKSIKKNTVHGETTTTTDCTFTVEVNGVKYTNCTYHLDMEYTKFNSRPYMNATITVCVPKGYNDLAAAVVYDNKVVAYIPMP